MFFSLNNVIIVLMSVVGDMWYSWLLVWKSLKCLIM